MLGPISRRRDPRPPVRSPSAASTPATPPPAEIAVIDFQDLRPVLTLISPRCSGSVPPSLGPKMPPRALTARTVRRGTRGALQSASARPAAEGLEGLRASRAVAQAASRLATLSPARAVRRLLRVEPDGALQPFEGRCAGVCC